MYYEQYRKYLVFKRLYPYLVVTDVANFFDTILYDRLADAVNAFAVSARLAGLMFFLLERLSLRDSYTGSPRIGLPVDEFDCSRRLAHMVLFPHDQRMVERYGEDAYVRWMDDQNIGVQSNAEGLRALSAVQDSLRKLQLTVNPAKSRVLSLGEAHRHFHLDINKLLDEVDDLTHLPQHGHCTGAL